MPSDCAPRHSYLKLALVTNTRLRGCEIPAGAERTFLLETATAFVRGDVRVSGVSGVSGVGGVGGVGGSVSAARTAAEALKSLASVA